MLFILIVTLALFIGWWIGESRGLERCLVNIKLPYEYLNYLK